MPARKLGRYMAPLALLAVIVATVVVVESGLKPGSHPTPATSATRSAPRPRGRARGRRFYFIHNGDTLSSISLKTGVSVTELQTLNPSVAADPNALQTGERLKLR